MAPWAQCPSERPARFVVPPLGLLGCGCLEGGVANRDGDHVIALRGIILVHPVPQVRSPNAFTNRQLFLVKPCCNQQRFGAVLIVDLPPSAQRCWRAVHDSTGSPTARIPRDARLGEYRPGFGREHRLETPVSQQCKASW